MIVEVAPPILYAMVGLHCPVADSLYQGAARPHFLVLVDLASPFPALFVAVTKIEAVDNILVENWNHHYGAGPVARRNMLVVQAAMSRGLFTGKGGLEGTRSASSKSPEFAQPHLSRVKPRSSPAKGCRFGCVCS